MHKSALLGFALSFALLAACGGEDIIRGRQSTGGLTGAEYARLLDLNRMAQDNIDARDAVHDMITPLLNEKSKPMSEKIAYPNCVKNGFIPDNDLTGQIHEQTISSASASCPIRWFRRRGWKDSANQKTMVMVDNLEIRDINYRKNFSRMAVRSLSGDYRVVPRGNRDFRVTGTIIINDFQTMDHGRITGSIGVTFERTGNSGTGVVVLSLNGNRWGNSASITWRNRDRTVSNVTYRVNDTVLDKKQFDDLFSSYELDKYMDNALNMK